MTIFEKIKFEEDWLSEVNLTKENIKIAFAGIRATALESQRWIPVSERLPEEREWYLAVFKEKDTGFQLIPRVADYRGQGENKWQIIDEDSFPKEYLDLLECVAWMPLPEPYKAESEDEV